MPRMLAAAGADASRPEDLIGANRAWRGRLPAVRSPGERNPRHAPESPDRSGAGKTHRANTRSCWTTIVELIAILENPTSCMKVIRDELAEIKRGIRRRAPHGDLSEPGRSRRSGPDRAEDVVVTMSHARLRQASAGRAMYRAQQRGGKGTHGDRDQGRGFRRATVGRQHARHAAALHQRRPRVLAEGAPDPEAGRGSRGKPIVNLLPLEEGEKIRRCCRCANSRRPLRLLRDAQRHGEEDAAERISRPRANGIIAIDLDDGDGLVDVAHHRRHARRAAVRAQRQGRAFRRRRSASDGPHGAPACAACARPTATQVDR